MKSEWDHKVIEIKRVTRVIAGGKRFKIRAIVISGNRNGLVGVGLGKGDDIAAAVERGRRTAEKNAVRVPIVNETVPYEVIGKLGAGKIFIKPAAKGKGLRAGGAARTVLDLVGIKNITAKILGTTKNPLVNTLATLEALKKLSRYNRHNANTSASTQT